MSEPTPTDPPQYYVLVTQAGLALEAASHASGQPLRLASIAVGDGLTSGTAPAPAPTLTNTIPTAAKPPCAASAGAAR